MRPAAGVAMWILVSIITMGLTEIPAFLLLALVPLLPKVIRRPVLAAASLTLLLAGCGAAPVAEPPPSSDVETTTTTPTTTTTTPTTTTSMPAPPPPPAPVETKLPKPPAPKPPPPPEPPAPEPEPAPEPRGACDPSYPDVCIAPGPPDLDCGDLPYDDIRVLPPDPHRLDGNDNDGVGCES